MATSGRGRIIDSTWLTNHGQLRKNPGVTSNSDEALLDWFIPSTGGGGATEELDASSSGASTSTGAPTRARGLASTDSGTSTTTGALTRLKSLGSSSAGTPTSSGALIRARGIASTSSGSSGETAAMVEIDGLQAVSAGSSVSDAGLSLQYVGLVGGSVGQSADMSNLSVTQPYEPPPVIDHSPPATGGTVYFEDLRERQEDPLQSLAEDDEMAVAIAAAVILL